MEVITCDQWNAAPARADFAPSRADGIVIHNTETPPRTGSNSERTAAIMLARKIQRGHFDRGFSDTGQHFTVSKGGIILEGRHGTYAAAQHGQVVRGAHVNPVGHTGPSEFNQFNSHYWGIENEGYYVQKPHLDRNAWERRYLDSNGEVPASWLVIPDVQIEALVELCAYLMFWGKFGPEHIIVHKKANPDEGTDCPGLLEAHLPDIRKRANDRCLQLAERPIEPVTVLLNGAVVAVPAYLHKDRVWVGARAFVTHFGGSLRKTLENPFRIVLTPPNPIPPATAPADVTLAGEIQEDTGYIRFGDLLPLYNFTYEYDATGHQLSVSKPAANGTG